MDADSKHDTGSPQTYTTFKLWQIALTSAEINTLFHFYNTVSTLWLSVSCNTMCTSTFYQLTAVHSLLQSTHTQPASFRFSSPALEALRCPLRSCCQLHHTHALASWQHELFASGQEQQRCTYAQCLCGHVRPTRTSAGRSSGKGKASSHSLIASLPGTHYTHTASCPFFSPPRMPAVPAALISMPNTQPILSNLLIRHLSILLYANYCQPLLHQF